MRWRLTTSGGSASLRVEGTGISRLCHFVGHQVCGGVETENGQRMVGQMSFAEFAASVAAQDSQPPANLSSPLRALWYDARGDWSGAHALAQEDITDRGAWVHAYLHRKEGDVSNAGYWYARAGRPKITEETPLRVEWEQIARDLLGDVKST